MKHQKKPKTKRVRAQIKQYPPLDGTFDIFPVIWFLNADPEDKNNGDGTCSVPYFILEGKRISEMPDGKEKFRMAQKRYREYVDSFIIGNPTPRLRNRLDDEKSGGTVPVLNPATHEDEYLGGEKAKITAKHAELLKELTGAGTPEVKPRKPLDENHELIADGWFKNAQGYGESKLNYLYDYLRHAIKNRSRRIRKCALDTCQRYFPIWPQEPNQRHCSPACRNKDWHSVPENKEKVRRKKKILMRKRRLQIS